MSKIGDSLPNKGYVKMSDLTPPPPCGCTVKPIWEYLNKKVPSNPEIIYCPLHANAPRLRDALIKEHKVLCVFADWEDCDVCTLLTSCREKGTK